MNLDAVDRQFGQATVSIEHHLTRFARQAEDRMDADLDPPVAGHLDRVEEFAIAVAAIDGLERHVMRALQTVFDPDLAAAGT